MSPATAPSLKLRWFWIPLRVLLVSSLLALLSFAVSLLLGILGVTIGGGLLGVHPDMTLAYRNIAFPAAAVAGAIALGCSGCHGVPARPPTKTRNAHAHVGADGPLVWAGSARQLTTNPHEPRAQWHLHTRWC